MTLYSVLQTCQLKARQRELLSAVSFQQGLAELVLQLADELRMRSTSTLDLWQVFCEIRVSSGGLRACSVRVGGNKNLLPR